MWDPVEPWGLFGLSRHITATKQHQPEQTNSVICHTVTTLVALGRAGKLRLVACKTQTEPATQGLGLSCKRLVHLVHFGCNLFLKCAKLAQLQPAGGQRSQEPPKPLDRGRTLKYFRPQTFEGRTCQSATEQHSAVHKALLRRTRRNTAHGSTETETHAHAHTHTHARK